ncbi:hypothetical protein BH10ACT3_BH10ACT3_12120 [soil metagenome]
MTSASSTRLRPVSDDIDITVGLGAPARRALAADGLTRLEQLAAVPATHVAALHGMGPKAMGQLRRTLAAHGLAFADEA